MILILKMKFSTWEKIRGLIGQETDPYKFNSSTKDNNHRVNCSINFLSNVGNGLPSVPLGSLGVGIFNRSGFVSPLIGSVRRPIPTIQIHPPAWENELRGSLCF